ncbi:MAG TPA: DUF4160 domain-containing protein [Bacteroidia bacterium]|nr:DUF4160 domain-containing protein [Bacteroidota bacterium]HRC32450.1 DUF4160 domain-containing protein [Bacteroidia bacterium]
MPEISRFLGIIIRMFYNEHNPPHFHAYYNEFQVEIRIDTLEVLKGSLPKRVLNLVIEWAIDNRAELLNDWELMRNDKAPLPIKPLI